MAHYSTASASHTHQRGSNEHAAISRLRSNFFATAGEPAVRYGITFDRLLSHIREARKAGRQVMIRHITHLDDLVHAVACIDGVGLAWAELAERYERQIVRRCRHRLDEIDATVLTRRMFAQLRHQEDFAIQGEGEGSLLRGYLGTRPLRTWLADRTIAQIAHVSTSTGGVVTAPPFSSWWKWKMSRSFAVDRIGDNADDGMVVLRFPTAIPLIAAGQG
jgi:hypothetical protein